MQRNQHDLPKSSARLLGEQHRDRHRLGSASDPVGNAGRSWRGNPVTLMGVGDHKTQLDRFAFVAKLGTPEPA